MLFDRATEIGSLISGTYIHALLVPHVACWISEVYALKASEIINKYMLSVNTRKLEEAEAECSTAKRARVEADVKLNKAEHARLDAVSVAVDAMCTLKHKIVDLANAEENIAVVEFDLIENKDKLKKTEKALTTWASSHGFTMLRLNSNTAPLPYYVIRCLNG